MMAEFDFCCKAGKPSLEYDVCKDLDEFKKKLAGKLGKHAEAGESSSWWNRMFGGGGKSE